MATETNQPKQGWFIGCIGLIFLVFLIAGFLAFPMAKVPASSWLLSVHTAARAALGGAGPFIVAALLGATIGLAEVTSTFSTYPREALQTTWAWMLVLVNAVAAGLAFWAVRIYGATDATDPFLLAIGVGIGFQALIRTKFTLAKQFGGLSKNGEVSVNVGWIYDQFQNLCKTQIDFELINSRQSAVTRLLERYPTVQELYGIAASTIVARATFTAQEEKALMETLNRLVDEQAPTDLLRAKLALFILEVGGQAYVDFVLEQISAAPGAQAVSGAPVPSQDALVRQLVEELSLDELVKLCEKLTSDPALINWIQEAAKPTPGLTEAQQKSAIANRLVQEVGVQAVSRALEL